MSAPATLLAASPIPEGRRGRNSESSTLPLFFLFGVLKMLLQGGLTLLSVHAGYGIFRDELYYLVCARRLALGYVDQPPLVAVQALLADAMFGHEHLLLFRLLPSLAGALTVVLTGLIAQALGGSRRAVILSMLVMLTVPAFLATQSFLSMNAWDPVFWMMAVLAMLRLPAVPGATGWWLLLGAGAGLGLENKASAIFLIAAMLLGLALTPARYLLRQRGFLLAVGVTLLLALPNLLWQATHGWATWEWLKDVQHSDKDVVLPPARFLLAQVLLFSPFNLIVWLPGALWLLLGRTARPWRAAGALYWIFLLGMLLLHAKDYYLAPVYPLVFAAGAVFWTEWAEGSRLRSRAVSAAVAALVLVMPLNVLFAVPVLRPEVFQRVARGLHFQPMESEQHPASALPEFYADQLGWQELADDVSRVYRALPPAEQRETGIFAANYGQASAINVLGRPLGLPTAISGHQNYWLWGPDGYSGREMIVIATVPVAEVQKLYARCTVASEERNPFLMPWEQRSIYVCYDRKERFAATWDAQKLYR